MIIGVLSALIGPAGGQPGTTTTTTVPPATAELLVDLDTGKVLLSHNDHARLPPASLTKLITALIAVAWLPPKADIPVSAAAANVYPDKVGMKPGQRWPLPVVLRALLIDSANDAAYAVAQKVGGSLARFGPIMQQAARQMGMGDNPVLHDPAGLDGTEGVAHGNLMSAWDVAVAARDVLAQPLLRSIVAMRSVTFKGPDGIVYDIDSKNRYFLNTYPGAIGVKTGYTVPAGLCIAAASTREGRTLLAVVMHGASTYQTAEDLLNRGFAGPVSGESASDPVLPPVHEPAKPAAAPPAHSGAPAARPAHQQADPALASRAGGQTVLRRPTAIAWVAAGVIVFAAVLILRQVRRSRARRPIGAHSRPERG